MSTLGVLGFIAVGLFVAMLLLLFLPKKKPAPVTAQVVPQYVAPPVVNQPQRTLSLREQQVQEKVAVLVSYYVDKDNDKFKQQVVDEALQLLASK